MSQSFLTNILRLSIAERLQLIEDIWESIVGTLENLAVTDVQKHELEHRLALYQQEPNLNISWTSARKRIVGNPQQWQNRI
ncbi:MAG: addiction module protein [Caldilineaceae bacterium]